MKAKKAAAKSFADSAKAEKARWVKKAAEEKAKAEATAAAAEEQY